MNAQGTGKVTPESRMLLSPRIMGAALREFCRVLSLDPRQVSTNFPNLAALINELGTG